MKRKLTKILGVGLAFVVITSLFGFALPMSADPGDVIWEPFPIPPQGAPTYVMQASIASTGPIESIGDTIYVAAWDDDMPVAAGGVIGTVDDPVTNVAATTTEIQIYRSVNGGRTFARTAYSVDTEVINSANPGFPITDICIIDANTVYVSNGWDIFKTIDGGANWIPLTNLFNYGAAWLPWPPAGVITSIDVGVIGTDIYVFAGVNDGFAAAQNGGGAFVCWEWALGMPWEQLRIDTNRPPTPGGWGAGTADVFDIRADPNNFATTQAILAVAHYDGTGGLASDPAQFTVVTSKHLGHEWNSYVGDAALNVGNATPAVYVTAPYRAEMWLPENFDYHLLVTSGMEYFVGIASTVATEGDVYQIIGGVPNAAVPPVPGSYPFDLNIAGPLTATDVSGLDGAGVSGAATLLAAGDPPAPFAGIPMLFRSATNGALWFPNAKGPTGNVWPAAALGLYPANAMPFVTVADDFATSGVAWIATQGFDCGVSLTEDFGSTSNTIGLIATDIDLLLDFSVSADGSLMFLATDDLLATPFVPTPATNTNSIWRFDDFWERIWSDTLSPLGAGDDADWVELTPDGALFTLDADGLAGAFTIFRSLDLGQSFLPQLTPVGGNDGVPDAVSSWAPINATTVLCGCAAGEIDRTSNNGVIWAEIPTAVIPGAILNVVIEPGYVDPGAVLAADAAGNVGFSPDGGITWIPLGNTGLPAGNTYLAFDANYGTNGISYATSVGGGVARTGFPLGTRIDLQGQGPPNEFPVVSGSGIISTLGPDGESVLYVADTGGALIPPVAADQFTITGGGVIEPAGTITVLTGSVLVTPTGAATIAGVVAPGTLAITPGMGPIAYTLTAGVDTLVIDATAAGTSGTFVTTVAATIAAITFDGPPINATCGVGGAVGTYPFSLPDIGTGAIPGGAAAVHRALDPRAPVVPGVMPYWETTAEGLIAQNFVDPTFGQDFLWASNGVGSTTLWTLDALGLDICIYNYTDTLATRVVPTTPADGDAIMAPTTGPWTVTLGWTGLSGATDYQVQIALNATFTAPTFCGEVLNYIAGSTSATYVLVPGCSNNATYFWRVRAAGSGAGFIALGFGAPVRSYWSLPQSFTTSPAPPARINIIVMPPAGAQDVAINTTFQWEEIWGAQHYQWELATDSTFATILDSQSPIDPFCQPANTLDYDTTYAWRVRAMADTTPMSDWVRSSFHTEIAPTDPVDVSDVTIPPVENITPVWIWVIVAIGAVLVIVVLVLIWLTRQGR